MRTRLVAVAVFGFLASCSSAPREAASSRPGGDSGPLTIRTWAGHPGAQDPDVAVDPAGGAVVVWMEPGAARWEAWAQRLSPTGRWQPAQRLSDGTSDGVGAVVALDASGGGWAAWCQWDGTDATVWAAPLAAGSGWGAPVAIESRPGYSCMPRLAVNTAGAAAVAWGRQVPDERLGARTDAWVSRLGGDGAWGPPELLSDGVEWGYSPEVVLGPSGETTVAWNRMVGMRQTLWSGSAAPGAGFGAPVKLSVGVQDVYGQTSLAVDGAGRVVALWPQGVAGVGFVAFAARRDVAASWGAAEQVGDGSSDSSYFPTVALNHDGSGLAAWKQNAPGDRYQIQAARLDPVAGWGAPVAIEQGSTDADYPAAAIDDAGDGLVAWSQLEAGTIVVRTNRFMAGEPWLGASDVQQAVAALPCGIGYYPLQLGMSGSGRAVVAWSEDSM